MKIHDPQNLLEHETMDIYAEKEHKVTVTEKTINFGYDHDKKKANQYLKVGEIYIVDYTDVLPWSTDVYLQEFPGVRFNVVHFVDLTTHNNEL